MKLKELPVEKWIPKINLKTIWGYNLEISDASNLLAWWDINGSLTSIFCLGTLETTILGWKNKFNFSQIKISMVEKE